MMIQMKLVSVSTIINILLLLYLFVANIRSYMRVKAQYTLFLLVFIGLFLVQNMVSGYYLLTMMEYYVPDVGTHILILSVLQTIAFALLAWMQRQ
jgi:hypothetical protein